MFYEEKIINNEYFYRNIPNGDWKLMLNQQLTEKILHLEQRIFDLEISLLNYTG